jgi:hypothetical protein
MSGRKGVSSYIDFLCWALGSFDETSCLEIFGAGETKKTFLRRGSGRTEWVPLFDGWVLRVLLLRMH